VALEETLQTILLLSYVLAFVIYLSERASAQEQSEFLQEIELMKNVGSHRNIITMIACCTKENSMCLVVEYAQHGDLLHLLKNKRNKVCNNL